MKRASRVKISKEELDKMTKDELHKNWLLQEQYLDYMESKLNESADNSELVSLRESEEKLKQQQLEAIRKENILVMRLTTKEQEMQEYAGQIQELKQSQIPSISQLRSALLDPAVNLMFDRMRKEIDTLKARLEETQNELNAWKFTPDSVTGKRLMAKCRLLYQENEELGKMISSGKIAKLEGDLALQKTFSEEMKKSQTELDDILLELDEDMEGLQSTVCYLQQQLRESKDQIKKLQRENELPETNNQINHIYNNTNNNNEEELEIVQKPVSPCNNSSNSTLGLTSSTPPSIPDSVPVVDDVKPVTETFSSHSWSPTTTPFTNNESNKQNFPILSNIKVEIPDTTMDVDKSLTKPFSPPLNEVKQEPPPPSFPVTSPTIITPSHLVTIPVRGSLHMEEYDSEQETDSSRTLDDSDITIRSIPEVVKDDQIKNTTPVIVRVTSPRQIEPSSKRTSDNCNSGTKWRKRTRASKLPIAVVEESVCEPKIKRLRRRNVIVEQETHSVENNRTSRDIDSLDNTDAEVEVAQALVNLSAPKKDRNKPQDLLTDTLGNGELLKRKQILENV